MLNGIEELNEFFENFFFELGFEDIECFLAPEFAYYVGTNEISYSLIENSISDAAFSEYLKIKYPNAPTINMFVFSLLHELGHYLTLPSVSKKKFRKWKKRKKMLEKTVVNNDTDLFNLQLAYCNLPDEKIATEKAIELLIENYDYLKQFEIRAIEIIHNFYKKNLDIKSLL